MIRARRLALALVLGGLAIVAFRDVSRLGDALPWREMYDFGDFYCAGEALDRGRDPYLYEPLRTCEHRVNAGALFRDHPTLAIPAPQPPYDFPPFMALAKLPFSQAKMLYAVAISISVLLAVAALARIDVPVDIAAMALVLPAGYVELRAGQIVPFALLFLTLSGAALVLRRDVVAGICSALVLIEPHLGLPVAAATFLFVPRARFALLGISAALALAGVVTVGLPHALHYALAVLPAQAASEVVFPYEYSLTYALNALGVPPSGASALGTASYVALLAFALVLAPRLARSLQRRELLVFLPAATAVMAGPYQHMVGLCFIVPAALVLALHARGWSRNVSAAALCVLIVPWIAVWGIKKLFALSLLLCVALLIRLQIDPAFATSTAAAIALAIYAFELYPPVLPTPPTNPQDFSGDAIAQIEWRAFVESLRNADRAWFAIKLPTWTAMAALLAACLAQLRSRGAFATSPESSRGTRYPVPASRRARTD
jgi:hypothetical protein